MFKKIIIYSLLFFNIVSGYLITNTTNTTNTINTINRINRKQISNNNINFKLKKSLSFDSGYNIKYNKKYFTRFYEYYY
jgi:hypothetical protein